MQQQLYFTSHGDNLKEIKDLYFNTNFSMHLNGLDLDYLQEFLHV